MCKKWLFIILTVITLSSSAQDLNSLPPKMNNNIYLEGFGNGLYYSINVENLKKSKSDFFWNKRIGFAILPEPKKSFDTNRQFYFWVPLETGLVYRYNRHYFELGIGLTYCNYKYESGTVIFDSNNKVIADERSNINKRRAFFPLKFGYKYLMKNDHIILYGSIYPFIFNEYERLPKNSFPEYLYYGFGIGWNLNSY